MSLRRLSAATRLPIDHVWGSCDRRAALRGAVALGWRRPPRGGPSGHQAGRLGPVDERRGGEAGPPIVVGAAPRQPGRRPHRAGPRAAARDGATAATCLTPASSTGGSVAPRTRSSSGLRTSGGSIPACCGPWRSVESWWHQSAVGDNGDSFGLFQVRRPYHCWGECRIARDSTAFNADYYGGILRAYFDGKMGWLNTVERGRDYRAGRRVGERRGLVRGPVVDRPSQGLYPRRPPAASRAHLASRRLLSRGVRAPRGTRVTPGGRRRSRRTSSCREGGRRGRRGRASARACASFRAERRFSTGSGVR